MTNTLKLQGRLVGSAYLSNNGGTKNRTQNSSNVCVSVLLSCVPLLCATIVIQVTKEFDQRRQSERCLAHCAHCGRY